MKFRNPTNEEVRKMQIIAGIIKEDDSYEMEASTPSAPADVKNLAKAQSSSTTIANKAKAINSIAEFPGAFENWFTQLGFQPGKISKSSVRSAVEKVLTNLGYK
jgi:hypothetical protein